MMAAPGLLPVYPKPDNQSEREERRQCSPLANGSEAAGGATTTMAVLGAFA